MSDQPDEDWFADVVRDSLEAAATPPPASADALGEVRLERWGVAWYGSDKPTCERKVDGYWTPWHLATAALSAMSPAWQDIATVPDEGTIATLYFPQHRCSERGLDYRYRLAIYMNGHWCDQGTHHDSFEGPDLSGNDYATQWLAIREPKP